MICTELCLLWKSGDCVKYLKIFLKTVCVSIISNVLIAPSQSLYNETSKVTQANTLQT